MGQGECGYWVLPAARGTGVAPRAVQAVTRWALDDLGVHRIELVHSVANPASCQVASKAGYLLEGTMRSASLHADGWHDMHLHARTAGQAGPDQGGPA
jgi:[ribosomal protein S5]-alanine N-acetyltransferase